MARAIVALLLLGAAAWAAPVESVAIETETYLRDAEQAPFGVIATGADGGIKGWLSLRALAWYPSLSGTGEDEGGGTFDLNGDLGINDNELAFVPQVTVNFWIFGFRMDYFDVTFNGEGTIQRTFTFGGQDFTVNDDVTSQVKLKNFRSLGFLRFVNTSVVRIAGIIGFNNYDYQATITSQVSGTATVKGNLPFPVVGLLAQVRVNSFLFEAEASGFYVDYSDVTATTIDFTLSAAWTFLKVGEVRVGYRYVSIDGTIQDTGLDIRLDGFFVGVGVTF